MLGEISLIEDKSQCLSKLKFSLRELRAKHDIFSFEADFSKVSGLHSIYVRRLFFFAIYFPREINFSRISARQFGKRVRFETRMRRSFCHFVSLAILRRKCNNLVDQLSAPLRVDASRHFATDSSPSKFLRAKVTIIRTLRFLKRFILTRARGMGEKEREREREGGRKKRKRKGRNPNTYRRNCYGIPLQAIVNLRKVARDCKIAWLTLVE